VRTAVKIGPDDPPTKGDGLYAVTARTNAARIGCSVFGTSALGGMSQAFLRLRLIDWGGRLAVRCGFYRILTLIGHCAVGAVFHGSADCGEKPAVWRPAAIRRKVFVAFAVPVTSNTDSIVAASRAEFLLGNVGRELLPAIVRGTSSRFHAGHHTVTVLQRQENSAS
jgi:hypothetical protein